MTIRPVSELVAAAVARIENLSVEEVAREHAEGATLVDIRDFRERLELGALPGAVHAPRGMLEFWADPASEYHRDLFQPDARLILYCAKGHRSALATATLVDMGFGNVAHLATGFEGWLAAGQEVEDVAARSKWVKQQPGR